MKHYGAVLSGDNNILDGGDSSILTIGTSSSNNDSIVIYNAAPATATANKVIGTDFGLTLVPYNTITYTGANNVPSHVLGADGREVAVADLSTPQDFNTRGVIPVASDSTDGFTGSGDGDQYIDSAISQTGAGSSSTITIAGNLQVSGTTTTVDSTTVTLADKFLELGTASADFSAMKDSGGLLIVGSRTSGTNAYGGFRWNEDDTKFEWSSDTTTGADGTWNDFGSIDSVAAGAGIEIDVTAPRAPKVIVDIEALDVTAGQGGLALDKSDDTAKLKIADEGIGEHNLAVTNAGTPGQVLSRTATNQFTWVDQSGGFAQKQVFTGSKSATATIAIPFATTAVPNTSHSLGADIQVQCFESVTGGFSQFIPESIVIAADGSVTITAGTPAAITYKVVIVG